MKLYKLGLLALTISLVATVIILDKKNRKCELDCVDNSDEDLQEESSNDIVVEESMV